MDGDFKREEVYSFSSVHASVGRMKSLKRSRGGRWETISFFLAFHPMESAHAE